MAKTKTAPRAEKAESAAPAYTVVARRYRPQQFADLIGQEHVAQALTNALSSGRVAHGYLFTGARGVGKTSCARILAKAINCVKGPTPTPCDACDICLSIIAGDDVDVVEIDAASNTGVDNIRELRQNVGFRPQRARNKVYIVDEVHMLSKGAFNALLKTLEEPPPHVKFIFATTEVQKIPVTILSRCQRFDFASIGAAKVFATLKHIVVREGLKADDDALHIIARRAGGSMRDAQTLLDQLLGFSDGPLAVETVHALLGTAGDDRVAELAAAILAQDAKAAVEQTAAAADRGLQLSELLDQLIDYWRGLMLVLVAGDAARDLPGTPALHEAIRRHAAGTTLDTILAGLDVLTATKAKLRGSPHAQVLLEVAVVRLTRMDELLSVSSLAQMIANGSAALPSSTTSPPHYPTTPSVKKNGLIGSNGTYQTPSITGDGATDEFPAVWEKVLQDVGPMRGTHLRSAGLPAILGPNSLAIRFPTGYSSAYESCASESGIEVIRQVLKRTTGKEWSVRVEQVAGAVPSPAVTPPPRPEQRAKDLLQLPLFRKAADVLGAQLVRVDDGFDPRTDRQPQWSADAPGPDEV
ncbi:MAG TPA: DNA polymerase III subunit gamma/tau [Fimbriiglobus sp.]|nr:DNA polymerase III subunit gamma/tau [Fimbriiglobus sp.]